MNPDGSNQTRLTFHPSPDGDPAWSADGSKIAFNSGRDGNFEIYVMNADGSIVVLARGPEVAIGLRYYLQLI